MAELKIDVTKLVGRCCEMVLDETEYAGKTLREWIADITNGDYVSAKEKRLILAYSWDCTDELIRCPACDKRFKPDYINGKLWNFCPECGVRMTEDKK